LRYWVDF